MALSLTVSACSRDETETRKIGFSSVAPSGEWQLGDQILDGPTISVYSVAADEDSTFEVPLPRERDLKFVGWGPEGVEGLDVLWIYSADIGSLLYGVGPNGVARLPCPPDLAAPDEWPSSTDLPCEAA